MCFAGKKRRTEGGITGGREESRVVLKKRIGIERGARVQREEITGGEDELREREEEDHGCNEKRMGAERREKEKGGGEELMIPPGRCTQRRARLRCR